MGRVMESDKYPYLMVKNWEKFQHYKGRTPPWIKLHRSTFDDPDFLALSERSQYDLIRLWMVASTCGGVLVKSAKRLQMMARITWKLNLKPLIIKGFLIPCASKPLASCKQNIALDTETYKEETETEEEKDKSAQKDARFTHPRIGEVSAYMREVGFLDPEGTGERFLAYYESNGWRVGKNPMRSWKAAVITWKKNEILRSANGNQRSKAEEKQQRNIEAITAGVNAAADRGMFGDPDGGF